MSIVIKQNVGPNADPSPSTRVGTQWPHHPTLASRRFVFRPLGVEEIQDLMDMAREHRRSDAPIGLPQPHSLDFVRTWMATSARSSAIRRSLHWAARAIGSEQLVGYTALAQIDLQRAQVELRLWVGRGGDREGVASEWARRLIDFAVDGLRVQRVYSLQLLRYPLAERILTGVGMQCDGMLRKRVSDTAPLEDASCWSISADVWRRSKSG